MLKNIILNVCDNSRKIVEEFVVGEHQTTSTTDEDSTVKYVAAQGQQIFKPIINLIGGSISIGVVGSSLVFLNGLYFIIGVFVLLGLCAVLITQSLTIYVGYIDLLAKTDYLSRAITNIQRAVLLTDIEDTHKE